MRRRPSVSRAARRSTGRAARAGFGLRGARLLVLAAAVLIGAAVLAPIGHATEGAERDAAKNARLAERAARHNARLAEKEAISKQREAERAAKREAHRLAHEAEQAVHLEKDGNVVKLACKSVTIAYNGFPELPGNSSTVNLSLHTEAHEGSIGSGEIPFEFDGSKGTQTIPVAFPVGRSLVDVRAKWDSNGHKGGFDIHGPVTCGHEPAFTVEKLQTIEGGTFTTSPITGEVGQTVFYEIIATNIGNTLLTFGEFLDEHCDAGTVSTTSTGASEPGQQVTYFCTHKLTEEDEKTSPLVNVAEVTGTPEPGEGSKGTVGSNPVEAIVDPHKTEEKELGKEKEPEKTGGEKTTPTPKQEVLGNTTTSPPASTGKSGVLGFASATVPALHGPQGCVRSAFTASVRSSGVQSVTFYLDGHKLKTLTYRSAHKGLLSIKVEGSKLKVGVHRLMAKVTMKQSSPSAKAAKATRSLMFVRCKSATVTPRFTG